MSTFPRPWPETWPNQITNQFSIEHARKNALYLENLLGKKWLEKGIGQPWRSKEHPIISAWRWGGADHFLDLNALAEDCRLVETAPGFAGVLRELKQPKDYDATRHMIRSAALLARGGNTLSKFFAAANDTIPDFEAIVSGLRTPAEAKLLTQSEPWRVFCERAAELQSGLVERLYPDGTNHPVTKIVVKEHDQVPILADLLDGVGSALKAFDGQPSEHREKLFNIFLSPPPGAAEAEDFVSVQITAPRSETEETRFERLVKKANRQLRNNAKEGDPGLMCLSITEHQDPHTLVRYLGRKFADHQFRSISGVLLHRPARYQGPQPIVVLDQLAYVENPNAPAQLPPFGLVAIGAAPHLLNNPPPADSLSCYAVGIAQCRILSGTTGVGLSIPRVLLPSDLQ